MKFTKHGFWKMRVAQKLIIGHIIETVTAALNTVLSILSEFSSIFRIVILAAIGSAMKNDMTKQIGIINFIS